MPYQDIGPRQPGEELSSDKRALTVDEFMAAYGPGRTTTYEEIKAGRLKALKLGRKTLIPRDSADAWLASLPPLSPKSIAA
jgi:excisionase family DNA binding protein